MAIKKQSSHVLLHYLNDFVQRSDVFRIYHGLKIEFCLDRHIENIDMALATFVENAFLM